MELLYEVKQPPPPVMDYASPESLGEDDAVLVNRFRIKENRPLCAISVKNLIAFTSSNDLSKKNSNRPSSLDHGGVYVADLNTPWECYMVTNYRAKVTTLNWDHTGVKLLIGTNEGLVEVHGMVEHLLNKWSLLSFGRFDGEPILTSCWLSAPRKVCLVPDKLDTFLYSEKYDIGLIANRHGFGGRALEGALVVTATGLVGAILNSRQDSHAALTGLEKLTPARTKITCADTAYSKDGELVVVTSGGDIKQPIVVKTVSVTYGSCRDRVQIEVQSAQSFFLQNASEGVVTTVKFVNKMNCEGILVAVTNQDTKTSNLYLYELVSEEVTLKPKFQTNNQSSQATPAPLTQQKWQQTQQIPFTSSILEFSVLPVPIALKTTTQPQNVNVNMSAVMQPLIAVSLANSCVHLIRCDTFQQVGVNSAGVNIKREKEDGPPEPKQTRMSPTPTNSGNIISNAPGSCYMCLQFSWSGCLLVAMDAKCQVHLYKIHPNIDPGTAASLIELSMMGGLDSWDIMMCLRANLIDNITDRLSEAFARQPPQVQNRFNARILVIKAALFRLTCGGVARTNDQQTLLILHLVSGALKALLRPSDLSSHDKGPAESLASLLSSKGEALSDVDKVLLHVEAKEYTVEPSLLQSLQQFLQWCADLALKLLATLPDLRHSKILGWEVCRDSKAIGTLRELIVLMRIWGLIRSSCLPIFRKTSESLDVLPLLFRLLTRLSTSPHDPDETLIDECCILPSEVQIPHSNAFSSTKNHGVASITFFSRTSPLQFVFGVNPSKWLNNLEGNRTNGQRIDGLRLLWLGKSASPVKTCNRCGCTTLIHVPSRSVGNKSWDNRFIRACPCGGNWKISLSTFAQAKPIDADFEF